ncbi:hypothetical protein SAMN05660772_01735 [Pasteurella testudinis DSM 23072]|uniref:DUF554 domain-containing protein n=1 Tax=Pasteurella testudinis DSM 23072 TaxID=1122938 RepID=A0A1W1UIF7_9PAST|nr:DUF554 domain-containing protein [Pasteurella testudinis]SMB80905.1 hypothetical protein SAMN05660772_01735 [Pasteurella testudinis DSM 23072]SUB52274.1 Protein of uncharacterised function (DUF554) [Pasteurella testudinis]
MILSGVIVNAILVVVGGILGSLLANRAKAHIIDSVLQGLALCVLYVAVQNLVGGGNIFIIVLSVVTAAIIGEWLKIDNKLTALGDWLQEKINRGKGQLSISEGFVNASLLFCVGAMGMVGSLESGLAGNHQTLYAKAVIDGMVSIVFASTMGIGVAFSAIPILLYQGLIVLTASLISPYLSERAIAEMSCVGGLLILAIALNMLKITQIRVANFIFAPLLAILFSLFL